MRWLRSISRGEIALLRVMTISIMDAYPKATLIERASTGMIRYFHAFPNHVVRKDDDTGDLLLLQEGFRSEVGFH